MRYNYIAIDGNIGVGKTALAVKLAVDIGAEIIHEEFENNAFLEPFYEAPKNYAFPLEISFLLSRLNQLKDNPLIAKGKVVADYYFGKSLVFARNNLPKKEFKDFQTTFEFFNRQIKAPDLIIYLHNEVQQLQTNIRRRGRVFEQKIKDNYLKKISLFYDSLFKDLTDMPILQIDVSCKDFVNDALLYQSIKDLLKKEWPKGLTEVSL